MIKAVISSYIDKKYLSIDLEQEGIEFANINVENNSLRIEIYKSSENINLDFNELMSLLVYAKEELLKTYPNVETR